MGDYAEIATEPLLKLRAQWLEVSGPEASQAATPTSIEDGVVVITVSDEAWLDGLTPMLQQILDKVRKTMPDIHAIKLAYEPHRAETQNRVRAVPSLKRPAQMKPAGVAAGCERLREALRIKEDQR